MLGRAYWLVVIVASVFTLARFSEAFLLLRAQSIGLPLALVPGVMVVMNVVYALVAWPAGTLSDTFGRYGLLTAGFGLLLIADLALAFANSVGWLAVGVALWGLHMGLTQGLLASLVADTVPGNATRDRVRPVQSAHRTCHAGCERDCRRTVGPDRTHRDVSGRRGIYRDRFADARRLSAPAPDDADEAEPTPRRCAPREPRRARRRRRGFRTW